MPVGVKPESDAAGELATQVVNVQPSARCAEANEKAPGDGLQSGFGDDNAGELREDDRKVEDEGKEESDVRRQPIQRLNALTGVLNAHEEDGAGEYGRERSHAEMVGVQFAGASREDDTQ